MRDAKMGDSETEKDTVVKTFRLNERREGMLVEEAKEVGVSANSLMNSILAEYQDWSKKAKEAGFVWIHRSLYRSLVDELDEKKLIQLGQTVVPGWVEDMARYLYQSTDPERILDVLESRYSHDPLMKAKFTRDGQDYTLVFAHDLGMKFSILVEATARELVTKYFRVEPRINRGESVVTVRFRAKTPVDPFS